MSQMRDSGGWGGNVSTDEQLKKEIVSAFKAFDPRKDHPFRLNS